MEDQENLILENFIFFFINLKISLNFDEPNNVPFLSQNFGVTPSFDVAPEYEISFLAFTKKKGPSNNVLFDTPI